MDTRAVRLLHVEDDPLQQVSISLQLAEVAGLRFEIAQAVSEDEAVAKFAASPFEVALVDYHLKQGDGLHCLKRIRQIDPQAAVIAISGLAGPEIIAELLAAGAADCLDKLTLTRQRLVDAIRNAIACTDAWRQRAPARPGAQALAEKLRRICDEFSRALPSDFLSRLDAMESEVAELTMTELHEMFRKVCADTGEPDVLSRKLRPLELEFAARLVTSDSKTTRAATKRDPL